MTAVHFKKVGSRWQVRFPYDPRLVEHIKQTVPSWARSYDPATKIWTITDRSYAMTLGRDFKSGGFHTVVGLDEEEEKTRKAPPPPPPALPTRNWADELLGRCSPTLQTAVYRQLSKALHADVGGDGQLQQELNDARNKLLNRTNWQPS
jgi:hypothetical protein